MSSIDKVLKSLNVNENDFLLVETYPQEIGLDKTCINAFLLIYKPTGDVTLIWVYDTGLIFLCDLVGEHEYEIPETVVQCKKYHINIKFIEMPFDFKISYVNPDGEIISMPSWYDRDTGIIYSFRNLKDLSENVFVGGGILDEEGELMTIEDFIYLEYPFFNPDCMC